MVSYAYLNEADFSKLSHCADSWKLLQKKYQGLGEQFDEQVVKRLRGTWSGDAATKAFAHMGTVTKEYDAAGAEAARMGKLMAKAHDEFSAVQKQLRTFQEDAGNAHFKVHDDGAIEDVDPMWDSPTASGQPHWAEDRKKKQNDFADRLKGILRNATELDQGYAAAFKADFNGDDDMGFNKSGYATDDEALKAQKDADQAAKLIDKDGRLTPTELDQLDNLLAAHKGDPEFAARFAQKAGAENTLDQYNKILDPPGGTQLSKEQLQRIKSLQKNLGSTLGLATTVHSPEMDKFKQDLLKAADRDYNANPTETPYGLSGYQLTSSLMSQGDWDDDLLDTYGEHLIAKEKQLGAGGKNPDGIWGPTAHHIAGITHMPALDPMTGFMDALGHNPDASLRFLDGKTETVNGETVDNLDYLMKDRHWPDGAAFTGDDKHGKGIYTLGHALESASTGAAYDYNGDTYPLHTPEQAKFTNDLVNTLGDSKNADLIDGNGRLAPIKGSLGDITANYMGDFQQSFATVDLPTNGAAVGDGHGFDRGAATNFLSVVGQDPDAYKEINAAQLGYTQGLVDQTMGNHGPGTDFSRVQGDVPNASAPGSSIAGIMSEARAEAVYEKDVADAKDFNTTAAEVNKWVGRGAGIAIGTIASPVAGTATSIGYSELSDLVMKNINQDNTSEGNFDARDTYASGAQAHENALHEMIEKSARAHGYSGEDSDSMAATVARESQQTFGSAAAGAHKRG
jgi:hypothetical protein